MEQIQIKTRELPPDDGKDYAVGYLARLTARPGEAPARVVSPVVTDVQQEAENVERSRREFDKQEKIGRSSSLRVKAKR